MYRLGVGIMLMNHEGLVFVGQRRDFKSDAWQMPQGGIDPGESPMQAALRELHEEIGTNNASVITETPDWVQYDLPSDLQNKLWQGQYVGQRQKWFLMRFLGQDTEININTEHPEFSQWQWVHPDQLIQMIVPFKRDIYALVLKAFTPWIEEKTTPQNL